MAEKITIKTPHQISIMHQGGQILAMILRQTLKSAQPGTKTIDLENLANKLIKEANVSPSFPTVKNYPFSTCITVNEEVVHGLPGNLSLKRGDLLSLDLGIIFHGLHLDHAWTILVGKKDPQKEKFLKVGQLALQNAIREALPGQRIGHLSLAIQETLQKFGYQPVTSLTGHGIGKHLHEPPSIPCFLDSNIKPEDTPHLRPGMTLAIEVIYTQGAGHVCLKGNNHWTVKTKDESLAALFEHTIAVTQKGPIILTKDS